MSVTVDNLSPRRRRSRARKLEAIVDAALDIVDSIGFEALTMGRLAEAVDLSPGALYRYFSSKDALVATLQTRTIERIARLFEAQRAQWLELLPADPSDAALCELLEAAAFYLDLAEREPRAFKLVSATLAERKPLVVDDEEAKVVAGPLETLIRRVGELFERAAERGALAVGVAPLRTIVFWTSLHGVVSTAKLDRLTTEQGWFAPQRLTAELVRTLLVGWGASPVSVERAQAWQRRQAPKDWSPS